MRFFASLLLGLVAVFFLENTASFAGSCKIHSEDGRHLLLPELTPEFWLPTGALKKVKDGLALTIDRKVFVLDEHRAVKSILGGRCRLAFDIWAEKFILLDDSSSPQTQLKIPEKAQTWALQHCAGISLPNFKATALKVQVKVNPIDDQQEKETRKWLSTKGIGGAQSGIIGKALGAVINLRTETEVDYECTP